VEAAIFINSSLGSGERGKIRSSRLPKAIVEDAIAEAEGRYDEAAAGRSPDEFMKVAVEADVLFKKLFSKSP
jgi:hypothetical protein